MERAQVDKVVYRMSLGIPEAMVEFITIIRSGKNEADFRKAREYLALDQKTLGHIIEAIDHVDLPDDDRKKLRKFFRRLRFPVVRVTRLREREVCYA